MTDEPTATKKTTKAKKPSLSTADVSSSPAPQIAPVYSDLDSLIEHLTDTKFEIDKLEREIAHIKKDWQSEQKQHEQDLIERTKLEETERKQEKEMYDYEVQLTRKKSQDEFEEKKAKWEKELVGQKEQLDIERKELAELRKAVEKFPEEKDKALKESQAALEKFLKEQFEQEKKFLAQSHKSEIDVLNLKIANLESENSRQTREIETLKKSLDDITHQFRDIAVKAVEGTRGEQKSTSQS